MQATFWMAVIARDAVIAGDLAAAKRAASALAKHDYAGTLPAAWKHWIARMQQRADEVVLAPDLEAAAGAVAALGSSCGDCHDAQSTRARRGDERALPWQDPPDDVAQRMDRHAAGAEQLWQGLIGPSEPAWLNGTITLTRAPLSAPERDGEEMDPALAAQIEEVRTLAKKARAATSYQGRAAVYGELLARCANCHYVAAGAGSANAAID
jgi:hypothetical protein